MFEKDIFGSVKGGAALGRAFLNALRPSSQP